MRIKETIGEVDEFMKKLGTVLPSAEVSRNAAE